MKKSFSLIEVIFAIAFLIMVGVAMATLNNAAARLTETTELKQIALGLNEQSLSFVALEKRTKGTNFATTYGPPLAGIDCIGEGKTCYVVCPVDTSLSCVLQKTKATLQVGTSKLQFESSVVIRSTGNSYLVNATTSWGKGVQRQMTTARIIE